jgi:hypothetical protein
MLNKLRNRTFTHVFQFGGKNKNSLGFGVWTLALSFADSLQFDLFFR